MEEDEKPGPSGSVAVGSDVTSDQRYDHQKYTQVQKREIWLWDAQNGLTKLSDCEVVVRRIPLQRRLRPISPFEKDETTSNTTHCLQNKKARHSKK